MPGFRVLPLAAAATRPRVPRALAAAAIIKTTMYRIITIILAVIALASCGGKDGSPKPARAAQEKAAPVDTALRSRLRAFAARPRVEGRFGLCVYDLTAGREVFAEDADHAQPVASNMKLLCGVAALERLGARYKYVTSLYTRGSIAGDTLRGDIALKAGLDPLLKAEDMRMFARELRRVGIRHVTGDCLLDLTLRERVRAEEHWYPWDLSFSRYGVLFKGPDAVARAMRQALAAAGVTFVKPAAHAASLSSAASSSGSSASPSSAASSSGSAASLSSVSLPARFVMAGVPCAAARGGKGGGQGGGAWRCRFRFIRSVDRVTRLMWKNSSNTQATSLLYTLGGEILAHPRAGEGGLAAIPAGQGARTGAGALAGTGVAYLRAFLRDSLGLADSSLVVHDGCGLCTSNHLSPRALTAILAYGYAHRPIYRQLMQNLAVSGVDGTLRRLISDPRLRGRIHAKTGTLSHPYGISSLAGYCRGADGHDLCFALLDSEMSVLDAHVLQRRLCLALTGAATKR